MKPQQESNGGSPVAGVNRIETCRKVEALAIALGNVSEACRQCGLARRTYYAWKKAVEPDVSEPGASGRKRNPHPNSISPRRAQEIIAIALENPEWGCDRIAYFLELKGRKLSSPTVQKILIRNGLGKASQRRAKSGVPRPPDTR